MAERVPYITFQVGNPPVAHVVINGEQLPLAPAVLRRSRLISDLCKSSSVGGFDLPVRGTSLRTWLEYPFNAELAAEQLPELSEHSRSHYKQLLEVRAS